MDVNERINKLYHSYKADFEAASRAERMGNREGARGLYRNAARALAEMAELESGETRRQRTMHAAEVLKKAESLRKSADGPEKVRNVTNYKSTSEEIKSKVGPAGPQNGSTEENPWQCDGIPDTSFEDVVGMDDVKRLIRTRVIDQIKNPELYEMYGLKGGTSVLLFGLPGTGKTTIARAIAHELQAPLYIVQLSDILNKWVGESEKRIRQLFDKARESETALIFFDDFDALGMERQDEGNAHGNKMVVELINQMDGFRKNENTLVMLAATNKPWMIDAALMRPGRFEHHIYVPLPNHEARIALVKKTLKDVPVEQGLDMDQISDMFKGYNGADVVSVVSSAKVAAVQRSKAIREHGMDAISPIMLEDFKLAAGNHKSSVVPSDIKQMRDYALQRGIALPDEL